MLNFPFERMEWAVIFLNGLYLSATGLEADLWAYQVDAYTIRRWLYVERMTAGTHQGHGSMEASASLFQDNKKWLLLMDF